MSKLWGDDNGKKMQQALEFEASETCTQDKSNVMFKVGDKQEDRMCELLI